MKLGEKALLWLLQGVIFFSIVYLVASLVEIFRHFNIIGWMLNLLTLTVEFIAIFYTSYFTKLIVEGSIGIAEVKYNPDLIVGEPKVTVIIPIHNVQPGILKETLKGFAEQTYKNFDIWIGDDSNDLGLKSEVMAVCNQFNNLDIHYYYDNNNKWLKAGMLNILLEKINSDFVAFFDVDQIPVTDILQHFVAFLQQHPKYTFVQAIYGYRNLKNSIQVFEAMSFLQFFAVNIARRKIKASIFAGTTACFRTNELIPFPHNTVAEDFALSALLQKEGKFGYQLYKIGSWGLSSETLGEELSRLYRWTKGQASLNSRYFKRIYFSKGLSLRHKFEIFISSTIVLVSTSFYALGLVYAVLYVGSVYNPNITIIRAFGITFMGVSIWIVILPVLMISVYAIGVLYTVIFANRTKLIKLNLWRVSFFLLFGMITAPYLILPALKGLLGLELPNPKKSLASLWNKKINYVLWAAFFAMLGMVFVLVGIHALLNFNMISLLFLSLGMMLIITFPFAVQGRHQEAQLTSMRNL